MTKKKILYRHLDELRPDPDGRPSVVTIGTFDGFHCGHQQVIGACVREAEKLNARSVVVTFAQHPLSILAPPHAPLMLTNWRRKVSLLHERGIDAVACLDFDDTLAGMDAELFTERYLFDGCGAGVVICGYDFTFGRRGQGTPELIEAVGRARQVRVQKLHPHGDEDNPVSSSRIRQALLAGNVEEAMELLGRPYELEGKVVKGYGRGHRLNFPTANIPITAGMCIPHSGVYAVTVQTPDGREWEGMANVGHAPTFGVGENRIEAHLFDFNQDIYGQTLRIRFISRLREILKFENAESLIGQMEEDKRQTLLRLKQYKHATADSQSRTDSIISAKGLAE